MRSWQKIIFPVVFSLFWGCKEDTKLTLAQIMAGLNQNMNVLVSAAMHRDSAALQKAAAAIAQHPKAGKAQSKKISEYLGDRIKTFQKLDNAVHDAASAAAEAAQNGDFDAAVDHILEIQKGCFACHSEFQEELKEILKEAPPSVEN